MKVKIVMVNKAKSRNKKKKSFKCNTCAVWKGGLQQSYRISVSCHLFLSLGVSWNTTTAGSGANPAELKTLASEKKYFWIYGSCWSFIMDSLSWSVGARGRHFGFLLLWFFGSCSTLGPKPSPGNWTEIKSFLWFSLILQAFVQRQRKKKESINYACSPGRVQCDQTTYERGEISWNWEEKLVIGGFDMGGPIAMHVGYRYK